MALARVTLSFIVGSSAARFKRKVGHAESVDANAESRVLGAAGQVDSVYNWGSPGSASPGLQNTRTSSPCFPGVRTWHQKVDDTDMVTYALNFANLWHPWMDAHGIKIEDLENDYKYSCSEATTHLPPKAEGSGNFDIHSPMLYDVTAEMKVSPYLKDISYFGVRSSYDKDSAAVAEDVKTRGWRLVGSAYEDGSTSHISGEQVSHLIQHPSTLDCVVTFMGTGSIDDWIGNLAVSKVAFCGLSLPGETCRFGLCKTDKPRGSFVHHGFTEKLRKLTATESWEQNIHSHLPSCKKVIVVGQSAGAAMAELFQACVANAPAEGDFGYDEYKNMAWNNGQVRNLNYK